MTTTTIIPYDKALPEIPGRTPYTRPDAYLEKLDEGDYASNGAQKGPKVASRGAKRLFMFTWACTPPKKCKVAISAI